MSEVSTRLRLLEQRITVTQNDLAGTQKEFNEVLVQMEQAMTLLMRTNKTALEALQLQIAELGKVVNLQAVAITALENHTSVPT